VIRYVRDDALVPALTAPDRAYRILDERGRLLGVVAGHGSLWAAGRIMPSRTRPILPVTQGETRKAAAELLVGGRP